MKLHNKTLEQRVREQEILKLTRGRKLKTQITSSTERREREKCYSSCNMSHGNERVFR